MSELGQNSPLNAAEIKIIVKMAVRDVFEEMGLDMASPEGRDAARKDFSYIRKSRMAAERITNWILSSVVTVFIGGLAYALFEGIRAMLGAKGAQ